MLDDMKARTHSLLINWDSPVMWNRAGLVQTEPDAEGRTRPATHPENTLLRDSLSKEHIAEELKITLKQLDLVSLQNEHQAHVSRAAHT